MCIYIIYLFETIVSKAWAPIISPFYNYKYNFPWVHYLMDIESFSFYTC